MNCDVKKKIVNELLQVQAERAAIYEKLVKFIHHEDLQAARLFERISSQSKQCLTELRPFIDTAHHEPADRAEIKKEILHNCWPEVQINLPGTPIEQAIIRCECIESASLSIYEKALGSKDELGEELCTVLRNHIGLLNESHELMYEFKIKPTAPEVVLEERTSFTFAREVVIA